MTVKQPVKSSHDRDNSSGSRLLESEEFFSPTVTDNEDKIGRKNCSEREVDRSLYGKPKVCATTELETDQESIGSSEEMESPRSVTRVGQWTPKKIGCVRQILRIREEYSHLAEDIAEGLSTKDYKLSASGRRHHHHHLVSSHTDVVLFSRPILPASPLSGKTVH